MSKSSNFNKIQTTGGKSFTVDTTFVLFFLAIEIGRTFSTLTFDNAFLIITLLMLVIMPYFLAANKKHDFPNWLLGRSLIASFAMLLGMIFQQLIGVILPETVRFLPMTLLIISAMLSCCVQFYGFLRRI